MNRALLQPVTEMQASYRQSQSGRSALGSSRGFTLVELMVVVVIVGVLAVIGLVALRQHIFGSKSVEALSMIQSIRAAQERWRAENFVYFDVTTDAGGWYPADPRTDTGRIQYSFAMPGHGDYRNWSLLDPTVTGPVEFGYRVNAGNPSETMTAPLVPVPDLNLPNPPGQHWYVIQALADADGDGVTAFYLATSLKADIARVNEGE